MMEKKVGRPRHKVDAKKIGVDYFQIMTSYDVYHNLNVLAKHTNQSVNRFLKCAMPILFREIEREDIDSDKFKEEYCSGINLGDGPQILEGEELTNKIRQLIIKEEIEKLDLIRLFELIKNKKEFDEILGEYKKNLRGENELKND